MHLQREKAICIFLLVMLAWSVVLYVQRPHHRDTATAVPTDYRININAAPESELQLLSGVGDGLAQRIVTHRQTHGRFANMDDLDAVSGVGPRLIERIEPWVMFGESVAAAP